MSLPAPPNAAFRNHLGVRFNRCFKRALFTSTLLTISYYYGYFIPHMRDIEVAWNTIDPDRLFKNMVASNAFTFIDDDGHVHVKDLRD